MPCPINKVGLRTQDIQIKIIGPDYVQASLPILGQLNKSLNYEVMERRFKAMFLQDNYVCFGLFEDGVFCGLCGGWTTTRIYCGKQLEIDNLVIDEARRSKGYGNIMLQYIESWCREQNFESIELNTYVQNAASHKFYFNLGYKILGFHFQKVL